MFINNCFLNVDNQIAYFVKNVEESVYAPILPLYKQKTVIAFVSAGKQRKQKKKTFVRLLFLYFNYSMKINYQKVASKDCRKVSSYKLIFNHILRT